MLGPLGRRRKKKASIGNQTDLRPRSPAATNLNEIPGTVECNGDVGSPSTAFEDTSAELSCLQTGSQSVLMSA